MTSAKTAPGGREVASGSDGTGTPNDGNISSRTSLETQYIVAPGVDPSATTPTEKKEQPKDKIEEKKIESTQPSDKDARHASRKINDEVEKRLKLSQRMIERDPESIYDIAEEDPELAERLLKENPDLGADSIEELLEKKDGKGEDIEAVTKKVKRTSTEVRKLQEQLKEERVLRLKEKHPDLKDDLEEEFRKLYSDERFSDKTPDQLLSVARALTGTSEIQKTTSTTDVALDLLKQQEGVQTTVRGSSNSKVSQESAHGRAVREAFGHSEDDLKKYLPENIDEILGAI